jgi:hypothetical protein
MRARCCGRRDWGAGRASGYPRLAQRGREILFAWTEGSEREATVRTAAIRLP